MVDFCIFVETLNINAKENKYMKSKKPNVKETLQIHSQAKVEFYKTYLERYLVVLCMSKYIKNVNIYDVFCGKGIYDDGGKGSPVVAYDTIKRLYETHSLSETKITLHINDKSKERITIVKNYIEQNKHPYCAVKSNNLDVDELFKVIIPEINSSTSDTRNIIFIDPYGYKNIKKELIYDLMRNGKTEIILFLPISHIQRFTNVAVQDEDEIVQYEPLRDFVYSFFPDPQHPVRQNTVCVKEYIKYISDSLRFNNHFFTTSYYIERDKSNYFALFFISHHIFGFEKILEVKWTLDEDHGGGFKLPAPMESLFAEEFAQETKNENAKKLKNLLIGYLKEPQTNRSVYEFVLDNEFLPKHANEVLTELQKENTKFHVEDINSKAPARKGAFYISYKYYSKPVVKMYIEQ